MGYDELRMENERLRRDLVRDEEARALGIGSMSDSVRLSIKLMREKGELEALLRDLVYSFEKHVPFLFIHGIEVELGEGLTDEQKVLLGKVLANES
jgi:hypothetical protein